MKDARVFSCLLSSICCLLLSHAWLATVPVYAQGTAVPTKDLAPARRVVAVLPFTNISGQAADAWIGRGIAEAVMADLERAGAVSVVGPAALADEARRQAVALTQDDREAIELGRRLGWSWLVRGGYQRLGDQIRITGRVVTVETGDVTRTVKLDGTMAEIFDLQDGIVAALGPDLLGPAAATTTRTSTATASTPQQRTAPLLGSSRQTSGGTGVAQGPRLGEPPVAGVPGGAPRGTRGGAPESVAPAGPGVSGVLNLEDRAAAAANSVSVGILAGRPSVSAVRVAEPPSIDGRLDDAVWRTAARVTEFVQQRPLDGAPATEQTEVYVAYDSRNIYFGIYAHYSDPGLIRANRVDRDQVQRDDTVNIYFDPFLDQQRAYVFSVNGYGVQGDSLMSGGMSGGMGGGMMPMGSSGSRSRGGGGFRPGGGGGGMPMGGGGPGGFVGDTSWDALFESAGTLVADGWTAELAIPFKSLRYPARERGEVHRWGFQLQRDVESKNESVVWAPVSRDVMGFLRQMGVLEGLTNLSTSRNLEIMPTFTAVEVGNLDRTTGVYGSADTEEGGVNVKYGITSNLTFDFAYNPDFSQVESDQPQIEVNQRFPLFYPELRPFFLEGHEIFNIPAPLNLVHTRTIVDPRYGAKLTGKVGKTTLGVLVANDEAPGKVDDPADPAFEQTAQVVLGRVRYDLYSESYIGFIFTDREFVDTFSRVGGVDGQFMLGRNHRLAMKTVFTDHRDSAGVKRTGNFYDVNFRKEGRNFSYLVVSYGISPDVRTDAGFARRIDQRQTMGNISYRWWPESWIINWGPQIRYERNYAYDRVLQDEVTGVGLNAQFAKNINLNASVNRDMERFGGINFWKTRYAFGGFVNTSRRFGFGASHNTGDQVRYVSNPFLGDGRDWNVFMNLQLFSRFQSDINLTTSDFVDPRVSLELFDVKIFRARTTYQFTERFLVRNIMEYNTFDKTVAGNLLLTYRINAGTVFYVGYDDRYRQEDRINSLLFTTSELRRTNRAIFTKLQYLFRY